MAKSLVGLRNLLLAISLPITLIFFYYLLKQEEEENEDKKGEIKRKLVRKVLKKHIPLILGNTGMNIREIQDVTGTRISILEKSNDEWELVIRGRDIENANQMIHKSIYSFQNSSLVLYVPVAFADMLLEHHRKLLKEIAKCSNAKVALEGSERRERKSHVQLTISGTDVAVKDAKHMIFEKMSSIDKEEHMKGDPWCGQKASGDSIEQVCSKKLSFDDKKIELMVSNERVEDADNNASQSFYENCCEHSSNHTDSYYSEDFEKIYEKTLALQNSYKKDKKVTFKELDRCEAIHIKENDEVIDGASVLYKKEHMKLSDSLCIENRKIGTETKKDKIQKEKLKNIMQSIRENDLKLLSKKDKKLKYPCVKYYKSMGKLMRLYREIGDKNYKKYPSLRRFIIENTERKCVMDEEKWFESKLESQVNKEKHGDFRNMDRLKKNEDMRVILEKKEKVGENYKNNDEKVSSMKIKKNVEDESDMKGDSQQTESVNRKSISKSAIETTKEHKLENNVDQVDNVQNTVEDKNQLKSRMKKDSEKVDDFMVEIAENEDVIKHNDAINVLCKLEKCEMGAHKIDINTLLTFIEGDRQDEESVHKKGDFIAKSSLTKTSASEDLQGTDTKVVSMVLGDLNKKQIILEQEYLDKELQDGNLVDDTGFVTVVRKRNKHSLCEEVAQNENNQLPIENVNEKCISKSAIETTKEHKLENNVDQVDNVQNTVEDKNQLKSRMKKDSEKVDDFMVEIAENEDVIKHNDAINVLCKLDNFLNLDPRLLNLSNDIFPNESQDNIPPSHFFVQNSSLNLTNTVHHSHEYSIQSSRFEPQTDRHIELLLISQNQNVFSTSSESVSLISFTVSDTIINASSSFVSSHKCCHNIENISTPDRLVSKLSSTTKSDPLSKINFTSNSSTIKHRIQSIEKVETINKAKKRKKKKSKSSKSSVSTVATIVQPESQTTKKRGFNQIRLAMIRLAKEDPSKKKEKLLMVEEPQDVVPKYHHFSHQHHHSHLPSVNHPVYPLPHYHINHQTKTL